MGSDPLGIFLNNDYVAAGQRIVREQLATAGVRIAEVLRREQGK